MLFSATMTKKVAKLQRASLKDPVKVRRQISCVLVQDLTSDQILAFMLQSIKKITPILRHLLAWEKVPSTWREICSPFIAYLSCNGVYVQCGVWNSLLLHLVVSSKVSCRLSAVVELRLWSRFPNNFFLNF